MLRSNRPAGHDDRTDIPVRAAPRRLVSTFCNVLNFCIFLGLSYGLSTRLAMAAAPPMEAANAPTLLDFLAWLGWLAAFVVGALATVYVIQIRRSMQGIHKQTQAAEELFTDLAKAATDWIWEADSTLKITSVSEGFARTTGYDQNFFIGETWHDCANIEMDEELRRSVAIAAAAQRSFRDVNCRFLGPDGEVNYFKISGRPFFDANGQAKGYRGGGVDISDLVEAKDRVRFLDRHDALTGLPNRLALREELGQVLRDVKNDQDLPVLIAIDIARFGTINDAFGATAGDHVLRQFGERLHVCLRPDDSLFRQGNDEFMILRPAPSKFETLQELLDKITQTLGEPFEGR